MLKTTITAWSRRRLPQESGRIYVDGLEDKVSIQRDSWGIPHIEAKSRHDLFFAQGFVHAQDRLWQMEVNRRVAKGELAALLGPPALETDRLTRTLGFAYMAAEALGSSSDKVRNDVAAYTDGVNAYIADEHPLPIEFALLRHRPEPWDPLDSAAFGRLMLWTLSHGWAGELTRARLLEKVGPELARELEPIYPADNPLTLPQGIEFNRLEIDGMMGAAAGPYLARGMEGSGRGSNGWIISAGRSASGHAILCNDVHLPMTTPSLWYHSHLKAESGRANGHALHVTGASLPGLPYILIGHNESIAWGATLSFVDCEDLFIERFDVNREYHYLLDDNWLEADVRQELIEVKGDENHTEHVITTRHGPVISSVIDEKGLALSLQSTALMSNESFDGIAQLNEARNWDDFVESVRHIENPSLNIIYADSEENIGYFVSGKVPVRAEGQGLLPTPGWLSENDWQDFIPFEEMPHSLNPEGGYMVTANNRIVDDDYPHYLGSLWMNGFRARRITEMLEGRERISAADCQRMQMDLVSIPGTALAAALPELENGTDDARQALALLRTWDGLLDAESVGGAIYQVFIAQLTQDILEPILGRDFADEFLGAGPHPILVPITEFHGQWIPTLLRAVQNPNSLLWSAPGGSGETIERCLARTIQTLRSVLGDNMAEWRWGRLHQIRFDHLMAQQPPLDLVFGHGSFPIGGDMNTVLQTATPPNEPLAGPAVAPSYRQIIDMGELDNSRAMFAPGQSGHLGSPHYSDMVLPWLQGEFFEIFDQEYELEIKELTLLRNRSVIAE